MPNAITADQAAAGMISAPGDYSFTGGARTIGVGTGPRASTNLAQSAAQLNLAAMPDLQGVSNIVNRINMMANQARVPGGAAMEQQSSENIGSELRGELPQSFLETLQQAIAERGAATGISPESPNFNAASLRALGLSSLDLMDRGQSHLTGAYNRAAPLYSAQEGLVTPGLLENQQYRQGSLAQQAAELSSAEDRALQDLAYRREQLAQERDIAGAGFGQDAAELAERRRQFESEQDFRDRQLSENLGLSYSQLGTQQQAQNLQYQLELARQQAAYEAQLYAQQEAERQFNYYAGRGWRV